MQRPAVALGREEQGRGWCGGSLGSDPEPGEVMGRAGWADPRTGSEPVPARCGTCGAEPAHAPTSPLQGPRIDPESYLVAVGCYRFRPQGPGINPGSDFDESSASQTSYKANRGEYPTNHPDLDLRTGQAGPEFVDVPGLGAKHHIQSPTGNTY